MIKKVEENTNTIRQDMEDLNWMSGNEKYSVGEEKYAE